MRYLRKRKLCDAQSALTIFPNVAHAYMQEKKLKEEKSKNIKPNSNDNEMKTNVCSII